MAPDRSVLILSCIFQKAKCKAAPQTLLLLITANTSNLNRATTAISGPFRVISKMEPGRECDSAHKKHLQLGSDRRVACAFRDVIPAVPPKP